ncbi:MAG TPA: 30S ribosomal protein S18 [Candidatus Moranbacteria bacterium]|nr:30S ribosomal protein S18 [Candidatus Moranbacteria bacterium]
MNALKDLKKSCQFCQDKVEKIDYKDADLLRRFLNSQGRIYPPRRFGTCAKHQRILTRAIKRSRIMGFIPFVIK